MCIQKRGGKIKTIKTEEKSISGSEPVEQHSLLPLATLVHNNQISTKTGFSPSELFLGKPPHHQLLFSSTN
jgi:hypothetical protein